MLMFSLQGPSELSPDAALAAALGAAVTDYGNDAEKVHIHIAQVLQIGDRWSVVLQIVLEPSLDKKDKKEEELKKTMTLQPDEKKPEKSKKPETQENLFPLEELQPSAEFHLEPALLVAVTAPQPSVHIYVPAEFGPEPLYESRHYTNHPNYYFHFMEKGSLWNLTETLFPDIDLYETVHKLDIIPEPAEPAPSFQPRIKKPGLKLELTDER